MDETSKHFNKYTDFKTSVFELTRPFVCTPLMKCVWSKSHSERLSGEFPLRSFRGTFVVCLCVCVSCVCVGSGSFQGLPNWQLADEVTSAVTCKHSHKYINKQGIHGCCCAVYHCITYRSAVPTACVCVWLCDAALGERVIIMRSNLSRRSQLVRYSPVNGIIWTTTKRKTQTRCRVQSTVVTSYIHK